MRFVCESGCIWRADYYLTTTAKNLGSPAAQDFRGFSSKRITGIDASGEKPGASTVSVRKDIFSLELPKEAQRPAPVRENPIQVKPMLDASRNAGLHSSLLCSVSHPLG